MRQFAKNHFVVYLSLNKIYDHTFPSGWNGCNLLLDSLQEENISIQFLRSLVLGSLDIIDSIKKMNKNSNYEKFAKFQSWDNNENQKNKDFFEKVKEIMKQNCSEETLIKSTWYWCTN